uniref:Uncharacterized protein n=1 Tax=Rhodnius prolixus TaxID=13249 RepID=T1HJI3_RHOPR
MVDERVGGEACPNIPDRGLNDGTHMDNICQTTFTL